MRSRWILALAVALSLAFAGLGAAGETKKILFLGQGPDGHKPSTHEYNAGVALLAKLVSRTGGVETTVVSADEPWSEGPGLIDDADGVVIFLSQGAKWIHDDLRRLAALKRLAERKGAFVGLHWGIGCRAAEHIEEYVHLVGGCHGGPDRKYKVLVAEADIASSDHPITTGVGGFKVREEFYYKLKLAKPAGSVIPLIRVHIDDADHTVCWAWNRPDGGRSFGFSGGHFHRNWEMPEYRRLVAQGILWTIGRPIPDGGLDVSVTAGDLALPLASE